MRKQSPTQRMVYRRLLITNLLLLVVSFTALAQSSWIADTSFSKRQKITIDESKVSGSSHADYPILILLQNDTNLNNANVQPSGNDIRFTASDGIAELDYEIESFSNNASTGSLVAWVRIPTLSGTVDTDIYMYYSSATATNGETPANVWDSNYINVYHLEDTLDSKGNNNLTVNGGATTTATAIGNGYNLDGADDFLTAGVNVFPDPLPQFTMSGIVNLDVIQTSIYAPTLSSLQVGMLWVDKALLHINSMYMQVHNALCM